MALHTRWFYNQGKNIYLEFHSKYETIIVMPQYGDNRTPKFQYVQEIRYT